MKGLCFWAIFYLALPWSNTSQFIQTMWKYLLFTIFFGSLWSACQNAGTNHANADSSAPNTLTQQEIEQGWQLLFDGKSIDKWRGYNRPDMPSKGWVVRDGALVIESTPDPKPDDFGGDIITKEQFGNFELSLEFMITPLANSGIFYFVVENDSLPMWALAPEYQILDHEGYARQSPDFDLKTHCTCDNYDLQAAPDNYLKPMGEWNLARIVHKDGHVEHWLNGNKCIEYQVGSPAWEELVSNSKFAIYAGYGRAKIGHIGLQDHQHEVRFRNIKIRPL